MDMYAYLFWLALISFAGAIYAIVTDVPTKYQYYQNLGLKDQIKSRDKRIAEAYRELAELRGRIIDKDKEIIALSQVAAKSGNIIITRTPGEIMGNV